MKQPRICTVKGSDAEINHAQNQQLVIDGVIDTILEITTIDPEQGYAEYSGLFRVYGDVSYIHMSECQYESESLLSAYKDGECYRHEYTTKAGEYKSLTHLIEENPELHIHNGYLKLKMHPLTKNKTQGLIAA